MVLIVNDQFLSWRHIELDSQDSFIQQKVQNKVLCFPKIQ